MAHSTRTTSFDATDSYGQLMYTVIFRETMHEVGSMVPGYPDEDYVTTVADVINFCHLKAADEGQVPTLFIKDISYDMLKVIYNKFVTGRKQRRAFWAMMRQMSRANTASVTTVI